MVRVLAMSRVVVLDKPRLRFLCIDESVDNNTAHSIMSKVPYPCFDLSVVSFMFDSSNLLYIDWFIDGSINLQTIPFSSNFNKLRTKRVSSKGVLTRLITGYLPRMFCTEYLNLGNGYMYLNTDWLTFCNNLVCSWKPSFIDNNLISHVLVKDTCLTYSYKRNMFILTEDSIRHKPITLSEELSINGNSLECMKVVRQITKKSYLTEVTQIFDRVLRDWVTVRETEPILVLGRKER